MIRALVLFAIALFTLLPAARADAQTNTGAVRGYVRGADGQPVPDATVTAVDSSTTLTRNALTNAEGFYSLNALRPATYTISARRIGFQPSTTRLLVQVGQVLSHDFSVTAGAQQLATVTVTGQGAAVETRSSEASTNVSQQQINQLPTPSRNILDLAQLAPGVVVSPDRVDGTGKTFAAGALPAAQVNLFVDGVSQKNDITASGIAGQDASRGNPFPRNAVQEFRVITNNYKAEYQKASSAIITAVTKSGGNTWQGDAFTDYQNKDLTTIDTFTSVQKGSNANFKKPDYSRYLFGGSAGGPLIKDKLFFFGSYEGNFQNREGTVRLNGTPADYPAAIAGFDKSSHGAPFRENLGFAKLTYNMSDKQLLEFSGSLRHENETRDFGGQFSGNDQTFSAADNQRSNVYFGTLRHTYYGSAWTNEATAGYSYYQYNQNPLNFADPQLQYDGIGTFGGSTSFQNLTQKTFSLRDDFTYTGFSWAGSHVFKFGVNDDIGKYNFDKQLNGNPRFEYHSDNNYATPYQAFFGIGDGVIPQHNNAFGAYAQDDWSPTSRLTVNLGIRWDVETGMFNRDFVTPQNIRDSLSMPQYQSQFYIPVDPNRYFSDGTNRKLFLGAFQPRFGVSYALDEAAKTTVFASAGIFYDRQNSNATLDESYRRQFQTYQFLFSDTAVAGRTTWDPSYMTRAGLEGLIASGHAPPQEVFLVPNDLKPPKSDQFSVGVRHNFGSFDGSVSYNGSRGFNGYSYEWANVAYDPARNDCCISFNVPAYSNILVGNNDVKTWYNAMYLSLNRTYQRNELSKFGWGAGVAYTLAKAEQNGNDLFSFPAINVGGNARHPTSTDQRHQIVANFVTDIPYAWGIQFSGLMTLGSGLPYTVQEFVQVPTGGQQVFLGQNRTPWQKNVDFRLQKDFLQLHGNSVGITVSMFNVFNTQNLTGYDGVLASAGPSQGGTTPNQHFGFANGVRTDGRRIQLGATYSFK
ncbi:MAG: TonB-dependent receptor [Gemmatimonadaceae bacterium]|nr:TonB-dependent receptor [Gemmatimonadaceae bacterium]